MTSFPLYFPDSHFLRKQSWHPIIWFLSSVYSACSLYSVFAVLLILLDRLGVIGISGIEKILTLPMLVPLAPLVFLSSPRASGFANSNSNSLYLGFLSLALYFAVSSFLPSIIYRILLSGIFGDRWKK